MRVLIPLLAPPFEEGGDGCGFAAMILTTHKLLPTTH